MAQMGSCCRCVHSYVFVIGCMHMPSKGKTAAPIQLLQSVPLSLFSWTGCSRPLIMPTVHCCRTNPRCFSSRPAEEVRLCTFFLFALQSFFVLHIRGLKNNSGVVGVYTNFYIFQPFNGNFPSRTLLKAF